MATIAAGGEASRQRLKMRLASRVEGSAFTAAENVTLAFAPREGHLVLA